MCLVKVIKPVVLRIMHKYTWMRETITCTEEMLRLCWLITFHIKFAIDQQVSKYLHSDLHYVESFKKLINVRSNEMQFKWILQYDMLRVVWLHAWSCQMELILQDSYCVFSVNYYSITNYYCCYFAAITEWIIII